MFYLVSVGYVFLIGIVLLFICKVYRLPFFNAFSIVLIAALPIELTKILVAPYFNGITEDPYFLKAIVLNLCFLFVSLISLLFWIFLFAKIEFPLFKEYRSLSFQINKKILRRRSYIFIVISILFFVLTMILGGGGSKWIFNTREAYQFHRVGVGMFYALSITFLSLAYACYAFSFQKKSLKVYCAIVVFTTLSYFFGSKGIILDYAIFGLIVLWFYRAKGFYFCLFLVPIIIFPVMLYNLAQAYGQLDVDRVFSYFDYYNNSAMFYQAYDEGKIDFFLGQIFTGEFWSFVPRFFYPEKPFVYGFLHVNEYFFPGAAASTHTPAFGGPTQYYADFGVSGVLLAGFFNPAVIALSFLSCCLVTKYKCTSFNECSYIDIRVIVLLVFLFAPDFLIFFHEAAKFIIFLLVGLYVFYFSRSRIDKVMLRLQ